MHKCIGRDGAGDDAGYGGVWLVLETNNSSVDCADSIDSGMAQTRLGPPISFEDAFTLLVESIFGLRIVKSWRKGDHLS